MDPQSTEYRSEAGPHEAGSKIVYLYTGRRFCPVTLGREQDKDRRSDEKELYEVRIIDNDHNTYEEVIRVSMVALGINEAQAFAVAWEVDHYGSCVVACGPYEEAETVANVIRTIGIEVQVNPAGRTVC